MLEPQGVVEIKFRAPELIATMHRIDPLILKLKVGGCAVLYCRLYRCTAVLQVCWSAGFGGSGTDCIAVWVCCRITC